MKVLRVAVTSAVLAPLEQGDQEAEGVLTDHRRADDEDEGEDQGVDEHRVVEHVGEIGEADQLRV